MREVKFTTCYMCACRCGVKAHLEDGEIRFVQGNPAHPVNRGVLCGKGNAAVMKQLSPAKLRAPMLREPGAPRGAGRFREISWDEALRILSERLGKIRATDPNRLAFFTGRDQMQALTGLWARQFGTMNWAAHGGFCSVNMAAAGLLTAGFSFWEFGEPDWERARMAFLWGVAEDHSSNPLKLGLAELKNRGAKIVAVNPVRTGYQAIADEWIPVRPGTDGLLALSIAHALLSRKLVDEEFLIRNTNAPHLILQNPSTAEHGLVARGENGAPLCFDLEKNSTAECVSDSAPALFWEGKLPDGRGAKTVFALMAERLLDEKYSPKAAAQICGVPAGTIERLALEAAAAAFESDVFVPTPWTDCAGKKHPGFVGRPVAMHAMRGISARANGFQTCRAIHLLQALLGAMDAPGSHLAKPPYPKRPPCLPRPAVSRAPNSPLSAPPLGVPRGPEDLAIDENGRPLRIDGAFSWDAPLAMHGAMHMVLANAARGIPHPVDTLMIYMANIAWNSAMNPEAARAALTAKNENGEHRIPFVVVADAFRSETTDYADLVLPDTTYLERRDVLSLLDRPPSDPSGAVDAIRIPICELKRNARPFQEVLVELASRLKFPAFMNQSGSRKFRDYADFIVNYEASPGVGFLSGWRGPNGEHSLRGAPNPRQWEMYEKNECFHRTPLPPSARFMRFANRDYIRFAKSAGWLAEDDDESAMTIELYSETLRRFQLAGEGFGEKIPPDEPRRRRLRENFDPLPFWRGDFSAPESGEDDGGGGGFALHAVTQRPMFMYHSWDSQNAWLRQIADRNPAFLHRGLAESLGIRDGDAVWIESRVGRTAARAKLAEGMRGDLVWTWNAIAKSPGAWGLSPDSREATDSFLMNRLISEWDSEGESGFPNADPVTGQAAWYDLRVSVRRMTAEEEAREFPPMGPGAATESGASTGPGISTGSGVSDSRPDRLRHAVGTPKNIRRPMRDVLLAT